MIGGAEINFGGAREIYPTLDQMNKVKSKNCMRFSGRNRKFKRFFRPKTRDLKKKGLHCNFKGFSDQDRKFKRFFRPKTGDLKKKKRSSSQKRRKIRCQYTKNTNLGLDLRSRSPEPVNFFGVQSSLGGHNFRLGGHKQPVGGARPRYAPPWRRV